MVRAIRCFSLGSGIFLIIEVGRGAYNEDNLSPLLRPCFICIISFFSMVFLTLKLGYEL